MLSRSGTWETIANGAQKKARDDPRLVRTISSNQSRPMTSGPVAPSDGGDAVPSIQRPPFSSGIVVTVKVIAKLGR